MKHKKKLRRLGVNKDQRKALLKSLNTALAEKGKITTTLARAKELKREFEKLITLGKKGSLHARRLAYQRLQTEKAVYNIFDVYAPSLKSRIGGYTRIYKLKNRLGDNSEIAMIQLVDLDKLPTTQTEEEKTSKKKKGDTLKEVKQDLEKEEKATAEKKDEKKEAVEG